MNKVIRIKIGLNCQINTIQKFSHRSKFDEIKHKLFDVTKQKILFYDFDLHFLN